jgi:hypothetical protein
MMHSRMETAKFRADDNVRFVGTDTVLAIWKYNAETAEYQVQRGDDAASLEWVEHLSRTRIMRLSERNLQHCNYGRH